MREWWIVWGLIASLFIGFALGDAARGIVDRKKAISESCAFYDQKTGAFTWGKPAMGEQSGGVGK